MKKFNLKLHQDVYIETDFHLPYSRVEKYIQNGQWVEANQLYGNRITKITENGDEFHNHFILHIEHYEFELKRLIVSIFKNLCVLSKDFRCDFFLTKKGGYLPEHIDSQSRAAILIPLNKNTGSLKVRKPGENSISINYQTAILFNTQLPHCVESPHADRLIFRIGIHDLSFLDIVERLEYQSVFFGDNSGSISL